MTPFQIAYRKALKGNPISTGALAMAELIGEWFEGNALQAASEREVVRQLTDRVKKLEEWKHNMQHKDNE